MNIRSVPMLTRTLLENADKFGATIAPATRKKIEQSLDLATRINTYAPDAPSLSEAVVDALARDVDPLDDPDVLRAHLGAFIEQVRGGFPDATSYKIQAILFDTWTDILAAFKAPFDEAGEQLTQAHQALTKAGITELTSIAPTNSENLAVQWVRAHDALRIISGIRNVLGSTWVGIRDQPRYLNDDRMYDTDGEPTDHRHTTQPWEALGKGWVISLATPEEYEERQAAAAETKRAYTAQLIEEQKRQNGRISNLSMN